MYKLKLKVLRSYKLQLDKLGYIVMDGQTQGKEAYRSLLRSGKTCCKPLNTGDRLYQYNDLLQRYFNRLYKNTRIDLIPTYKALMLCCAFGETNKYYKIHKSVSKKLIQLGYIRITKLVTDDLLIEDTFNNNIFHTHKGELYLIKRGLNIKIN